MLLEIKGVQFVNKGAELMLHAALQKIGGELPDAEYAIVPDRLNTPWSKITALGCRQKIWLRKYRLQWGYLANFIPMNVLGMYGLVSDSEIDVVLDASGLAYTDKWGTGPALNTARAIRKWKKQGTKVVLLPQAFGPFTSERLVGAMRVILDSADLVFARDQVSYRHLVDIAGRSSHIRMAPDFTNLVQGVVPADKKRLSGKICIIPNYRMIDKTTDEQARRYIPLVLSMIDTFCKAGHEPYLLIHEGGQDLELGNEIIRRSGRSLELIRETHPLAVKGIIGISRAVVSSRFHGLISALSQGVPALGTGWSHKYEMLFSDYGFPEGLVDLGSAPSDLANLTRPLLDDAETSALGRRLSMAAEAQKALAEAMWVQVMDTIKPT